MAMDIGDATPWVNMRGYKCSVDENLRSIAGEELKKMIKERRWPFQATFIIS
jgi:hypothetical protein